MPRRIAHVSDLHFGRTDSSLVPPLLEAIAGLRPDLVVVSGDLTQRATREEFASARRFLDGIAAPLLVVPGNHDIPLWNFGLRFLAPRRRWSRALGLPWTSTWRHEEVVVVGLASPRPWLAKGGSVSDAQLRHVAAEFAAAPRDACRVVALHHPLVVPRRIGGHHPAARRAPAAVAALRELGTDMVLAGHLHLSGYDHVVDTEREGLLNVLAPSATSTRLRGETNGFYAIEVDAPTLRITLQSWQPELRRYVAKETTSHPMGLAHAAA